MKKQLMILMCSAVTMFACSCSVGVSAGVGHAKTCCGSDKCKGCDKCECSPEAIKTGKCACKKQ